MTMIANLQSLLEQTTGVCNYSLTDVECAKLRLEREISVNPNREIRISVIGNDDVDNSRLVSSILTFRLKQFVDSSDVIICHTNNNRSDSIIAKYCKLTKRKPHSIITDTTTPEWQLTAHPFDSARKKLIDLSDIVIFIDTIDGDCMNRWVTYAKENGCLISKRTIQ